MPTESLFKIRSFHTDSFGHVNNARYLELFEEARWQFGEQIGLLELLREENVGFIIMEMKLRFRSPVVEGDTVRIDTRLVTLGTTLGEVEQVVVVQGQGKTAAKAVFHFALIDRSSGGSVPIAGRIRALLLDYVQPQPRRNG